MKKQIFILTIFLIMLIQLSTNVFASGNVLKVVEQSSETKYLENNQGFISKTIVDSNSDTGEVTIELKLSNTSKETEINKDTEVFLVLDNSISMDYNSTENSTRKSLIVSSATTLTNKIYNSSSNVKIGVVRFASKWSDTASATGKSYEQPNASNLMCELTSNSNTVLNAISQYSTMDTEAGTNIYAGLKKAYDNFSSEKNNKIIILLTDGLPGEYTESYYDYESTSTIDSKTKSYIQTIGKDVTLISLLTGVSTDSEDSDDATRIEGIFGTSQNPTSGKFYNISDVDIENVVSNDIFEDIMEIVQNPINTTKIVDYFPEDITDNFDFSYVGNASTGEATKEIDSTDKTITWNIGTLKGNEVATLKYKLKLKDMNNSALLEKVISTNEKVVLTYKDTESKDYTVILDSSPKIKLTKEEEKAVTENLEDGTTAKTKLPNTGKGIGIISAITIITILGLISAKNSNKYKGIL